MDQNKSGIISAIKTWIASEVVVSQSIEAFGPYGFKMDRDKLNSPENLLRHLD